MQLLKSIDFFQVEETIWLANKRTNIPAYDFQFEPLFNTKRPRIDREVAVIARIGAIPNYNELYEQCLEYGFRLIHDPETHQLASELEHWYPHISTLTPKSNVYDSFPSLETFYQDFEFPVFIKGNRQTAKHNPELAVANSEQDFLRIKSAYRENAILHWQKVAIREFVSLMPLEHARPDKVQLSVEFRTFWWKGKLVGEGHYWSQYLDYQWPSLADRTQALAVAQRAAEAIDVPFLVIDLAHKTDREWIVIECNDAQESGYCGVNPIEVWRNIVALEGGK